MATEIARVMQALATPSRVMILGRLRESECTVTELAAHLGMEQSAVSHQLRVLRLLGLVAGARDGRTVVYALHDDHVAELLDQAVSHTEHTRLGLAATPGHRRVVA
ncbi:ArsR/SmtB family transcription factor [Miltoncostaea oceani]|uniref:ArsR/SmtB family transcription factor n=1 Tax=Miltoncostaea oceani TaxID=2843216 RepID=UPI002484A1FD|nr:metalloregulator ArsR/SmtB family transcription factor [Miltoncostaea oceani]